MEKELPILAIVNDFYTKTNLEDLILSSNFSQEILSSYGHPKVHYISSPDDFSEAKQKINPAVTIIDSNFPNYNQEQVIDFIRDSINIEWSPILYLDEEDDNHSYLLRKLNRSGNSSVVTKNHDCAEFGYQSLCPIIEEIIDVHHRHMQEYERRGSEAQKAYIDSLTGLYNKRGLYREFKRQEQLCKVDPNYSIGIVVLDLIQFGAVNNNFGHAAGDDALTFVSKTLSGQTGRGKRKNNTRLSDIIARFGGDEFISLFPYVNSMKDLKSIIGRVAQDFVEKDFLIEDQKISLKIRFKLGLGIYNQEKLSRMGIKDYTLSHVDPKGKDLSNNLIDGFPTHICEF